jgi:hypothetical protein
MRMVVLTPDGSSIGWIGWMDGLILTRFANNMMARLWKPADNTRSCCLLRTEL